MLPHHIPQHHFQLVDIYIPLLEENHKFISVDACAYPAAPARRYRRGDAVQQLVALIISVGIVDRFKILYIKFYDRIFIFRLRLKFSRGHLKTRPAQQSRQAVRIDALVQSLLVPPVDDEKDGY